MTDIETIRRIVAERRRENDRERRSNRIADTAAAALILGFWVGFCILFFVRL